MSLSWISIWHSCNTLHCCIHIATDDICCAVISNSSSTVSVPISNTDLVITLPVNILADTLLTMKGYVFHSETDYSSCWRMFCLWLHQKLSKYTALNLNGRLGCIAKENPIKCNNRKYTSQRFETWRDITILLDIGTVPWRQELLIEADTETLQDLSPGLLYFTLPSKNKYRCTCTYRW